MTLADPLAHLALAYIAAVGKSGYRLSLDEFNAYVAGPRRRTPPGPVAQRIARQIISANSVIGRMAGEPEATVAWLRRLRWVDLDADERLVITPLGRAVLAALDEEGEEKELGTELVLAPDDQLSYARVIAAIAQAGPAALVDGYFSIDQLLAVLQRTQIERLLVYPDRAKEGRVAALGQAVEDLRIQRPFEVRSSRAIHDRLVIPNDGPVRVIGTSLGGVGKRLAVSATMSPGPASDAVRGAFEAAWAAATRVASAPAAASEESEETGVSPAEAEVSEAS